MSLSPALAPKYPQRVTLGPNEVIVITGGSGFLGQHIIRVLNERADGIKEIRVVDIKPFTKQLEYKTVHKVKFYKADISCQDDLDESFNGATCIIHTAAVVDVKRFCDRITMKSVNFIGTTNVAFKCRQWNVPKLVLTSTVDAVVQYNSKFMYASEKYAERPEKEKKCLIGYYGFSKAQSEAILICERNRKMTNGNLIKSCILRPTVLYGELDPYYVSKSLKIAKGCGGFFPQPLSFHGSDNILQSTYAGNAAWAHVLAVWKLNEEIKSDEMLEDWMRVDRQTFFINDDTRTGSMHDFMKPFLALKGYKSVFLPVPVTILYAFLFALGIALRFFPKSVRTWFDDKPFFPTAESVRMVDMTISFDRIRATTCLDYCPIYSEEKALELSSKYYKSLEL